MLKHYFKIALRSLSKQKILTFINISGLSIGLACFILFLLYALNEFSFDRFHVKADSIYRVYRWSEAMNGEDATGDVYMPNPLGPALKKDLPEVQEYVRMQDGWMNNFVRVDDKILRGTLSYADPSFFTVFSFEFLHGSPGTALRNMNDVVLTESKAKEFYGNTNVLGRTLSVKLGDKFESFTVTGVTRDIPSNSSISYQMMGNWQYYESTPSGKRSVNNWHRSSYITYVQLKEGTGLMNDQAKLDAFRHKYYPTEIDELKKGGFKWNGNSSPISFRLHPLKESHTHTTVFGGSIDNVNPKTIWILIAIAGAVLLIACINFTTLAIGRSASRAREVGLRKVIGGERKQLIYQFLAEAVVLSALSALIALALTRILLPWFNELSGRSLHLSFGQFPEIGWMLAGLVVSVGILAGSYPALVLSGFKPIEVLKSKIRVGGANFFTRSLVTLQFAISIGLIISTLVILQQTKYMSTRNPGFSKENIVMVNAEEIKGREVFTRFKQSLASRPQILGVAGSELGLGEGTGWSRSGFKYNGTPRNVYEYYVDADYLKVMNIQLISGRNFNPAISSDTVNSVIVNEAMVRDFGWTNETAIGQPLTGYSESMVPVVIGVVKDFHFRPLREEIKPQLFHQFSDYSPRQFFVRIRPGDPNQALTAMKNAWQEAEPVIPFQYTFLDESLDNFYKAEQRWSNIAGWAGGISIFLACLGLFGLASLSAINRTKEIGIRKVLGASLASLIKLLSKEFLILVLIALLIAAPLSWFLMNKWLGDFAYRISVNGWLIAAAGLLALTIAFVTVGFQAIKAGIANPVKSLRNE